MKKSKKVEKKNFLLAVDLREENQHIEDFAYRKVLAKNEKTAKKLVYKELKEETDFDDFEHFEDCVYFCEEIDITAPSQNIGYGY